MVRLANGFSEHYSGTDHFLRACGEKAANLVFTPVRGGTTRILPFLKRMRRSGFEKAATADKAELELSSGCRSPDPCLAFLPPSEVTTSSQDPGGSDPPPALPGGSVGSWTQEQMMDVKSLTQLGLAASDTLGPC